MQLISRSGHALTAMCLAIAPWGSAPASAGSEPERAAPEQHAPAGISQDEARAQLLDILRRAQSGEPKFASALLNEDGTRVLRALAPTSDPTMRPLFVKLADVTSEGPCQLLAFQALDAAWSQGEPIATFVEAAGRFEQRPMLAYYAMQVAARAPDSARTQRFAEVARTARERGLSGATQFEWAAMRARMVEINARGVEQAHPTAGQLDLLFQYALGSQVDEHTTDLVTDLDPLPRWARAQLSARSAAQPDVVVQRLETTDFARFFERPEFAENAAEVRAGWVRERREWIVQYLAPQARALWAARHPK